MIDIVEKIEILLFFVPNTLKCFLFKRNRMPSSILTQKAQQELKLTAIQMRKSSQTDATL
jgi:hypothetical protein